jgi:hypothetical protein
MMLEVILSFFYFVRSLLSGSLRDTNSRRVSSSSWIASTFDAADGFLSYFTTVVFFSISLLSFYVFIELLSITGKKSHLLLIWS